MRLKLINFWYWLTRKPYRVSWVQKYRYYDSLINSFKDLSK